jgi:hypothetical protein
MCDQRRLAGRRRKSRRDGGHHHGGWKYPLPPQQERRHAQASRGDRGDPCDRLVFRGEIESDAGAECDGHPGQQAAGAGFRDNPFTQLCDERWPRTET